MRAHALLLVNIWLVCSWIEITESQGDTPQCGTPNGARGSCVDIRLCPYLLDALLDNATAASLQYLRASSCDPRNPSHVCCERPSCATSDGLAGACVARAACRIRAAGPAGTCRTAGTVCCPRRTHDGYVSRKTGLPEFGFCGFGSDAPRSGNASAPGQFPWAALLVYGARGGGSESERCGGALISARLVVTAAHCVDADLIKVRLGVRNLAETCADVRGGCPFTADVASTLVSPTYDKATRRDDIALITLAKPAPYTDHIRPICLPDNTTPAALLKSPQLLVAGWGVTQELSGNELEAGDDSLQRFNAVPLRGNTLCREALQTWAGILATYGQPFDATLPASSLCAGGTFSGELCAQDSGGPLTLAPEERAPRVLVAVHGRLAAGCRAPVPALYTPVLPHVTWIHAAAATQYGIVS